MKQTKFLIMALMASTLMMSSCALKKDLQNCQSENRELTQNYQDTKEKLAAAEAPDEVMLVLDGSTGQNAFEQAKQFAAVTNITSLAITKLDGTAKGGVVIGISDQLKVPVKYIGLGEGMEDMQLFNKKEFVDSLFKKSK